MGNEVAASTGRLPPRALFIVGTEACERFSYYGMRVLLVPFMIDYLAFDTPTAEANQHFFVMAVYFLPLLGGWLSDRFLGKYRTILYLSLFYCVGHATLAFTEGATGLLVGCAFIALGSGGIKPCVSAYVGDQFPPEATTMLTRAFNWFYVAVNVGSIAGVFICPWLLSRGDLRWAFGLPGIAMGLATFLFWLGRGYYVNVPPRGRQDHPFPAVAWDMIRRRADRRPAASVDAVRRIARIALVFLPLLMFWALFDQQFSTWEVQATQCDLEVWGLHLEAGQVNNLNAIFILVFVPVFTYGVYPGLERVGVRVTALRKMVAGMVLTVLSFAVAGLLQHAIDANAAAGAAPPSVAWQTIQYLLITLAEILVSITGLEFAYSEAPAGTKSTVMALWYVVISLGDLVAGVVIQLNRFDGEGEFYFFAALTVVATVLFVPLVLRYERVAARSRVPG